MFSVCEMPAYKCKIIATEISYEDVDERNWKVSMRKIKICRIRKYIDLILSILFILSVVLGYYKDVSHMSEYCFISGLFVGITFFISYLRQQVHNKPLNACIYLACVVDIFIIFIATVTVRLNLDGAFWFIHIINPIIILIYWFVLCDQRIMKWKETLSVVVFPLLYMLFAFVLLKINGSCPFPASLIFMDYSGFMSLVILSVLAVILWVFGCMFHMLKKLVQRK